MQWMKIEIEVEQIEGLTPINDERLKNAIVKLIVNNENVKEIRITVGQVIDVWKKE